MAALASSQDVRGGGMTDEEKWDGLEDPAEAWVDLVLAYRNRDLGAARKAIAMAKASKWTPQLWNEATKPEPEDLGWDPDEEHAYGSDADDEMTQHYGPGEDSLPE